MDELGFRFDDTAVIVDGWAHRIDCPKLPAEIPVHAHRLAAGDVYRSQRSPRQCRTCAPRFLTLLSYEIGTSDSESRAGPSDA